VRTMTCNVARRLDFRGKCLLVAALVTAIAVPVVFGQMFVTRRSAALQVTPAAAAAQPNTKAWTFEVVSIRPNKTGGAQQFGPTPNGYRMRNLFMVMAILTAYVPTVGGASLYTDPQTVGFPDWVLNDPYDIDATVSESDLAEWQKPASQPAMLRAMPQAMLADRLKLVAHRDKKELPVYSLVVGKNGPKFKETKPGDSHPGGITLPGGFVLVADPDMTRHFYGISMAMLAPFLSDMVGRPVEDNTGLPGKYDIVLQRAAPGEAAPVGQQTDVSAPDPGPSAFSVVQQLGLKLEPAKGEVETLVIDHVERPSPN
jgi:bla regulator protein BlaR1